MVRFVRKEWPSGPSSSSTGKVSFVISTFTSYENNPTKKLSSRSWLNCVSRFAVALCVLVVLSGALAQAQTARRERAERRVDSLSAQTLLSAPIVQLVDPSRQRLAEALVARQRPLFFASAFLEIAALLWMWRSGRAAILRDMLRRRFRNVQVLRLTYVWLLAMLAEIAAFPASFVSYRMAVAAGLSLQSPAEWLGQAASSAIVSAILAAVVFWVMLVLAEQTRLWYVFGAIFLAGFVLLAAFAEPVVLAPWLRHHQTLVDSPLATRLYAVERKAGVSVPIMIETIAQGSRADVSRSAGFGPTERIIITDTLLYSATPGELAFVVARESTHIVRHDLIRLELYATLFLIVAAAIAVTIADRIGFRRDDDPLSRLALLGTLLGLAILALLPVVNAYSRRLEARADHLGIVTTADPASGVRLMVRIGDINLLPVCPPQIVRRYFLTYPPVGTRIAAIRGGGDPCP